VVVHFLGYPVPGRRLAGLHFATGLADAAEVALTLAGYDGDPDAPAARPGGHAHGTPADGDAGTGGWLRGLFAGGTLAGEALLVLQPLLFPLRSNVPLIAAQRLEAGAPPGHAILDLGADEFTVGRPHPMLDETVRVQRLAAEAADPAVRVILLDVVLGDGVHPDPAADLAPAIRDALARAAADGRPLDVIVVLVGTDVDPQGLEEQRHALEAAGARVVSSVPDAAEAVLGELGGGPTGAADPAPPVDPRALGASGGVVNVGLEIFHDSLAGQGTPVVHVDWRPPAAGDDRLAGILARLR
jgi:FdrA protein